MFVFVSDLCISFAAGARATVLWVLLFAVCKIAGCMLTVRYEYRTY